MRFGHRQAQEMFAAIGRTLGYRVKRSFSLATPTDGVWFLRTPQIGELPIAALEVIVSEAPKTLRGSLHTLETVSPALGILLLQTHEIERGVFRNGGDMVDSERLIARFHGTLSGLAGRSRQRIEVWHFDQLSYLYASITGNKKFLSAA